MATTSTGAFTCPSCGQRMTLHAEPTGDEEQARPQAPPPPRGKRQPGPPPIGQGQAIPGARSNLKGRLQQHLREQFSNTHDAHGKPLPKR